MGWSLATPAITRKTDKGLPRYLDGDESDVFVLSGAEDLVPILDATGGRVSLPRTLHGDAYRVHLYRPRIEGLFARIERWTRVSDLDTHWRTITRDDVTTLFGFDDNSRISHAPDPLAPRRVFSYLISLTFDDRGNATHYEYAPENPEGVDLAAAHEANRSDAARRTQRYLKYVRYGNVDPYFPDWSAAGASSPIPSDWHFQVVFDYGDHREDAPTPTRNVALDPEWPVRPDPFSTYRAGFDVRSYRRCERVLLFHQFDGEAGFDTPCLVRSTEFRYSDEVAPADPRNPIYTFLDSLTQSGYRRAAAGYTKRSTPPVEFSYTQPTVHDEVLTLADADSRENLPEGVDGVRFQPVDLRGEGLTGILTEQDGGWGYKRNFSPINQVTLPGGERVARARFGPLERIASLPVPSTLRGGQQLLDLTGEGRPELVTFEGAAPGYFARTQDDDWEPLRTFASLPRIDWSEPNLKFVDLTGDGHADVLITGDDVYTFYPSLGTDGFGPAERVPTPWDEERGPRVVFADGAHAVSLADMSGDGLNDIVRVRAGEVCYWPNLGYGRFGAKVSMDGAPRFADEESFDARRVRFGDVDGSGTTDLLYVGDHGVQVCFNRSGNSWAAPQRLAVFPSADSLGSLQVVDLLGNGTACLVWSCPLPGENYAPLRYVDLMGSRKPHLMVRMRNNLGAETRLAYAPSTRFYLEDERDGRPWITRLPFPVQVVERVEVYDWIGRSRSVTRYAYHHGYFDGDEREFRGFGMVEEFDTEAHRGDTLFPDVDAANEDAASLVPPTLTRTWYHTGAFVEAGTVSRQYAHEYWVEPAMRGDAPAAVAAREAMLLADTVLDGAMDPQETREAYRALKGSTLRVEVYAQDGTPTQDHPYSVIEVSFAVRRVQPRGPNPHAVLLTHSREAVSYHYERQVADPRVTHDVTLEVDAYGNVRRSVAIGYGRRAGYAEPESTLSAAFRTMLAHDQTRLHVAATEHVFTAPVNEPQDQATFDAYRAPLPCETITAELTGFAPAATRFGFDEMAGHWTALWGGAQDIPYEEVSTPDIEGVGVPIAFARRVVERNRTFYRKDDLTALHGLGVMGSRALPGESYRLALTPGLVGRIFGALVTDPMLAEGGYIRPPGDTTWWIPSGRVFYSGGDADLPAQELAEAREHFYLPRRAVDPFGAVTRVTYDPHDLLPTTATDPVGNITSAENDYRVLQPFRSADPNGNRAEVAFDCLGEVVATAAMGKVAETRGDSLAGLVPDLSDAAVQAVRADPFLSAGSLLGEATSRLVYDLFAYFRTRHLPAPDAPVVYTLSRETHASDLAAGQVTRIHHDFSYSDGFGREAQHKAQAEPGPVPGIGNAVAPRWVGSGWTIYNNKGKPVRKYEPFFTDTHHFEFAEQNGVSSVLFYDPLDRVVGSVHPDNTWEKTIFDAWRQETWDTNDTVAVSDPRTDAQVGDFFRRLFGPAPGAFISWHDRRIGGLHGDTPAERAANQDAAQKAAAHADTPTTAHADSLGRTCMSVADNGPAAGVPRRYPSRAAMDTHSKPLAIFDARERRVVEFCLREPQPGGGFNYVAGYDVVGNPLCVVGMDGGMRRTLTNVVGKPLRAWDARGFSFRMRYDAMHRPTHRFVGRTGVAEILVERSVYGEGHPDADRNLKGRLYRHYDGAGVASNERYDFKGNLLESARHFSGHHPAAGVPPTYDQQTPDWSPITVVVDAPPLNVAALDAATAPLLQAADRFTAFSRFDAMNRTIQIVTPHAAAAPANRPSVIQPEYNEANLLERIDVWLRRAAPPAALLDPADPAALPDLRAVTDVSYNARGERQMIALGNGVVTSYTHDAETFRLRTLTTTRPEPDPDARTVQALAYSYDPVGNVTRLRDTADLQNVVYFRNQRVEPTADYTYDPVYRLTSATGREHLGLTGGAFNLPQQVTNDDSFRIHLSPPAARGDGDAMANYTERYEYDPVGNLTAMIHQVASGNWTRRHTYAEPSQISAAETGNRLSSTSLPGDAPAGPYSAPYEYDGHGNMTRMPHLPLMTWDADDRLQSSTRQSVNAGTPETTYYAYDASGARLRKITYRQAGAGHTPTLKSERLYLGAFEVYREYDGAGVLDLERETLHVQLEQQRIAVVETRTLGTGGVPGPLVRYQIGNHLGSTALELDASAALISYEEYFPFGSTSYQAARGQAETPNRYRHTGKERDEENDLYYSGARYYAPWLGRWISCDPAGLVDGSNLYVYVRNNPIKLSDPTGMLSWGQWAGIAAAVVVGTAVTILTAGLAGPLVGAAAAAVIGGIVGGAVGAGVGEAVEAHIDKRDSHIVRAMVIGGVTGGLFAGAGVGISAALRTGAGQALASRAASTAVGQVVTAVARRGAQSGAGRLATRAAAALREPAERLGTRISQRLGVGATARATAAAQARAAATQLEVEGLAGVTRNTVATTEGQTFTHSVRWRFGALPAEVTGAQVEAQAALRLTSGGALGQWGEGAYACEGALAPNQAGTVFQFRVPPGTVAETVTAPGRAAVVRLVPPPGESLVPIRITGTNFPPGALEAGRGLAARLDLLENAVRFAYPGLSADITGLAGGLGQLGNIIIGPVSPAGEHPPQAPSVGVSF